MSRLESWVEAKRLAADLDSMNESLKKTTLATTGAKIAIEQLNGSFKEVGTLNGDIEWPPQWDLIASGALSYNSDGYGSWRLGLSSPFVERGEPQAPPPIPPLKAPRPL